MITDKEIITAIVYFILVSFFSVFVAMILIKTCEVL